MMFRDSVSSLASHQLSHLHHHHGIPGHGSKYRDRHSRCSHMVSANLHIYLVLLYRDHKKELCSIM